jgi:hypothetical protein
LIHLNCACLLFCPTKICGFVRSIFVVDLFAPPKIENPEKLFKFTTIFYLFLDKRQKNFYFFVKTEAVLKNLKLFVHIAIYSFIWYSIFSQPIAYAEDSFEETIDCTDVSIHYVDDPSLTQEERLQLMEKAFLESLNRFELCQELKEMENSSSKADSNGIKNNAGDSTIEAGGMSGDESVASSTMSGTEAPKNVSTPEGTEVIESGNIQSLQDKNETVGKMRENMKKSNGKLPEDIPSAQNDDALAAQIRYAAENETDPVKRNQLWNEYRKYKGLPIK